MLSHLKTHTGKGKKPYTKCNIGTINETKISDSMVYKKQQMLNEIKNNNPFVSLMKDNVVLKSGVNFKKELKDFKKDNICTICEQSWYDQKFCPELDICNGCRLEKYKDLECHTFSKENNMIPSPQPYCLKILNDVEKAAIKLIKPSIHIYKRKGGGVGFSGNCISFAQNVESFAKSLPWSVKDLPIIIIQSANDTRSSQPKFISTLACK